MQMQLPIFPSGTKLINSSIGVFEKDNYVFIYIMVPLYFVM